MIHAFPHRFRELERLEELRLENNLISYVNGNSFSALARLRLLSLNGNRIRGAGEHAFQGLRGLQALHLEDNCLGRIPSTALAPAAPSLRRLRLGGNAFAQLHTGTSRACCASRSCR
ncbi:hypothetical protein CEXT_779551 [Caerostris extrusa]|uniref:Uncharacterized protein n=1 Tax=Caerostris extrusa TaxID=172846 RepID=A0AAV4XX34_CAEEX|nr:hypothetical protein CEXT_779551 [Caerostris extrusa]